MSHRNPVLLGLLLLFLSIPAISQADTVKVSVSVLPLKTLVDRIGGDDVETRAIVKAGFDPHSFEPTPRQITDLTQTRLYLRIGMPFEKAWLKRLLAATPDMVIVDAGLEQDSSHESSHSDHHHDLDPHIWTSPKQAIRAAVIIRDALIKIDPKNTDAYTSNQQKLVHEISQLDSHLQQLFAGLKNRKFLVFHPAWGHFAEHYQLEQVAIEHEGKQAGARSLARIIEFARDRQISMIFVQPQFDQRQARQIAEAINGTIISADPLAENYLENLRQVGEQFANALQKGNNPQ